VGKHLVLVGGGHAHMVTLAKLHKFIEKGHHTTVISPSPYHYYSGMGPGMLGKIYTPEDIRFATQHVVEKQGGNFVSGTAVRVDPKEKTLFLESGVCFPYDVLSFNVGSYVPARLVKDDGKNIYSVKPIQKLIHARTRILELASQKKIAISIIGGGPSAAEIAGNIWGLTRNLGENIPGIRIFAGENFMSRFPDNVRRKVAGSLTKRHIEILECGYVKEIKTGHITLESGKNYKTDIIFLAIGVKPSPIFKDKVGVYAVRENPVLYHNLMALLEETDLMPFDPGGDYLIIFNMGDGTGVLRKKWLVFGGRLAFKIKDYIDRKFMKKFQSIE